jgi:large subunit ribosomal protein L9
MKVILTTTVPKVGKQGTVANVADGFARNYLFPRGFAVLADKKQVEALDKRNARVAAKSAGEKTTSEGLRDLIDGKTVRIAGQVGKGGGKLFGAITSQDVANAIKDQLGTEIDRRKIALPEPLKRLGRHEVEIDLHRDVDARITVEIFDPAAPVIASLAAEELSDDSEE